MYSQNEDGDRKRWLREKMKSLLGGVCVCVCEVGLYIAAGYEELLKGDNLLFKDLLTT